jgi:hypothetical protein
MGQARSGARYLLARRGDWGGLAIFRVKCVNTKQQEAAKGGEVAMIGRVSASSDRRYVLFLVCDIGKERAFG